MGRRFAVRLAGQHPDLIAGVASSMAPEDPPAVESAMRTVILILLAVDGVLCALAAAFLLPFRLGGAPMPLSALVAGAVNLALVWAASYWTTSNRFAALPLWTWLATVAVLSFGGPGGDVVFGGTGVLAYSSLLLILFGASPAAFWLWVRSQRHDTAPARRPSAGPASVVGRGR